jgi:uncharacterized protein (DUF58 family)
MTEADTLFPSSFMQQLQALEAAVLRLRGSAGDGSAKGGGVEGRSEFRGHRPYSRGDDLRRLDWNAYGRLGKLFMREYEHERVERLTLFVDCSRSMLSGTPPKHVFARRVAAALGFLALRADGSAGLAGQAPVEGASRLAKLLDQLRQAEPGGPGLADGLQAIAARSRPPSDLVVITDGLEPLDALAPLGALSERRCSITLVQVLARHELHPEPHGKVELYGHEEQQGVPLDLNAEAISAYGELLEKHLDAVRLMARRHGWSFALTTSDVDLLNLMVGSLLPAGALP